MGEPYFSLKSCLSTKNVDKMSQYYNENSRYLKDIALAVLSVTILAFSFVVIALIVQRKCLKKDRHCKKKMMQWMLAW